MSHKFSETEFLRLYDEDTKKYATVDESDLAAINEMRKKLGQKPLTMALYQQVKQRRIMKKELVKMS
ncbi:hypothetical protein ACFP1L_05115 [Lactiplantibacillus nangangensis]|uniref:Uncharacterized protein n=1 Tax=Lactiplantibacillus nangangensis TaxID=2559917 RepID=A0ABW1SHS8_9LACO|nr:hypothetical protein [Lactiplantibacillus nangangensis]